MRSTVVRSVYLSALALSIAVGVGCGGGSAHNNGTTMPIASTAGNVQPIIVDSGPESNYANGLFTSISVCVPSSSTCQTIDGILVDTGSYGLRLLSSTGGGALTLALPAQNAADGNPVGECALFVSGYTWGSVRTADITISGEQANDLPVQVIDPTFASVPDSCKNSGVPSENTLQVLGANGILGIGPYVGDCGNACAQTGSLNPGLYYDCASSSCRVTVEPASQQVQNPIALFPKDDNGVIIQLPAVQQAAASLTGSMVFGIGTQSNNGLGSATVFPLDSSGEFTTNFKGKNYSAFVDSGSNALFFLDSTTSGLTECSDNSGFYCPSSVTKLSALTSSGSTTANVGFSVMSADTLFSNPGNFVFGSLAGPNPGTFDWGLPFFFGRNVYTAIESHSTPAGGGPFWAY